MEGTSREPALLDLPFPILHNRHCINKMPDEILLYIFLIASMGDRSSAYYSSLPFLLTLVCRSWKSLVIQSPVLWAIIPIDLTTPFDDVIPHLQLHLLLSRDAPLDITFSLGSTPPGDTKILSNLVSPHLHRLKSLTARLWDAQGSSMCIVRPNTTQESYLSIPLNGIHSFSLTLGPTMRHLSLHGVQIGHNAFALFQSLPQLTHLSFRHFQIDETPFRSSFPYILRNLRSLELIAEDSFPLGLFKSILFPRATILKIRTRIDSLEELFEYFHTVNTIHHTSDIVVRELRGAVRLGRCTQSDANGISNISFVGPLLRMDVLSFRIECPIRPCGGFCRMISNLMVSNSPRLDQLHVFESALGSSSVIALRGLSRELTGVRTPVDFARISAPEWLSN
jgi:hypothetical protein